MDIQYIVDLVSTYYPEILITLLCWLTYSYTLTCGFVSDDHQGMGEYNGVLQSWEYGTLWRWVRYHICGGNHPSKVKHKTPDGKEVVTPLGKVPSRHHLLSICVFNITCLVTYIALKPIVGEHIALLSILILIVHPCTTQGVAWISGLSYPISLFWISLTVILTRWFYANPDMNHAMIAIPLFVLIQFFAIHAIFATTALVCFLLLFLGYWQFAILGFLVSGAMCFDQIRKTVSFRIEEFRKQKMEASTKLNWRKFIVAMKTLWYYIGLSIAPIRMGLYHELYFHYDSDTELADHRFWLGLASLGSMTWFFLHTPSLPVKMGLLWFVIFSIGFWNFITATQFVTERYIFVANLGLGILIATLTQNYFWLYTIILAGYLVKTWTFLPTYDNEYRFYQSNCWNFQKSEVAYGNLGVTQIKMGLNKSALETWMVASTINSNYDVPFVNIFYQFRTEGSTLINNGDYLGGIRKYAEALPFLEKALAAKVCHFPEQWKKEHADLANAIRTPQGVLNSELTRLMALTQQLRNMMLKVNTQERAKEVEISITNNNRQINNLMNFMKANNLSEPNLFNNFNQTQLLEKLSRRQNAGNFSSSSYSHTNNDYSR